MDIDTGMLFQNWSTILRTLMVGTLAYAALVLMLRISGKRTLAKMNSFDLVVTVAIGSTLATILLNKDVSLAEGITAFLLLIIMQWLVTWLSVRSDKVREAVRAEPRLLAHRGQLLDEPMRTARITRSEILQSLRSSGVLALDEVEAVVLETNGELSVVRKSSASGTTSLQDVQRPD